MMVTVTNLFAAAYCLTRGVRLVEATPGPFVFFLLADEDGEATAALNEWFSGRPMVDGHELATKYKDLGSLVRVLKST
jgi:hypothetical protein